MTYYKLILILYDEPDKKTFKSLISLVNNFS